MNKKNQTLFLKTDIPRDDYTVKSVLLANYDPINDEYRVVYTTPYSRMESWAWISRVAIDRQYV